MLRVDKPQDNSKNQDRQSDIELITQKAGNQKRKLCPPALSIGGQSSGKLEVKKGNDV